MGGLPKQNLEINFSQGLDTKTDPFQVSPGKFLDLENSIFTKGGLLKKRNGFGALTALPDDTALTATTYFGNLLAIGNSMQALSANTGQWYDKGDIEPLQLSVAPAVRTNSSQSTVDVAVASNGLACAVWYDANTNSYYQIVDSATGEIIVQAVQLPATAVMARAFALGRYFIITFLATVAASPHLRYIAIPIQTPATPSSAVDISTDVLSITTGYDGVVANNSLFLAWNGDDVGGAIRLAYLTSTLVQSSTETLPGYDAPKISIAADTTGSTPVIWLTFWDSVLQDYFHAAYSQILVSILAPVTNVSSATEPVALTSSAANGSVTMFAQFANTLSGSSARCDYIVSQSCSIAGVFGTLVNFKLSVGLASKPFYVESTDKTYILTTYRGPYQPTYFLLDTSANIVAKLAYANGAGYAATQVLPSANVNGDTVTIGYLYKNLIAPINKTQQAAAPIPGIYTQTGINLATFDFNEPMTPVELGNDLHLSGGQLWMYDGVTPVEHSFHLWPENLSSSTATIGGDMTAQVYYYVATYEWTDAQGNIHRSAPSLPFKVDISASGTSTNTITLNVPYLKMTGKGGKNPARIVIYRWSTAQQVYYQITSISSPTANNTTTFSFQVGYVDTVADSTILGNTVLYTTGGVIENIAAPAVTTITPYRSRLFAISAENEDLLLYSKQTVQSTPVEMSDLLTLYVSPTIGAQGNTGPMKCIVAMDDKLIITKRNALYYLVGNGPDITGNNNDYNDPVFITSTVGCENPRSIVQTPQGIMFQSDKGIWLLGRDLSTSYIGAPVEDYNDATVVSALTIPGTNQVRFTLDSGVTLTYDYYFGQWSTFVGIPGIASCLYQNLHTYINDAGQVYKETPDSYLDGSNPVLMKFRTSWFHLAGLQGYQRAYFFYLLGTYKSPHKLNMQIAYDYNSSPAQADLIEPDNFTGVYGDETIYGGGSYGGSSLEQWSVSFEQQKCQSFQIIAQEVFDPTIGVGAGEGLSMSGLNLVVGVKKPWKPQAAAKSVG